MANTRNDITLTQGAWVNLYAASGIAVGTACTILNKSGRTFYIAIAPTAPAIPAAGAPFGVPIYPGSNVGNMGNIPTGSSGLWGYALRANTVCLLQE